MDPDDAPSRWQTTEADAVQIMTMHGSKGLEFDLVFALGLSERTPPGDEEADAEKLRQLYVAATRAKRRLYLPIPLAKKSASEGRHSPIELFCHTLGRWEEELQRISAETSLTIERLSGPLPLPEKIELPKRREEAAPVLIPPFQPSYLLSFTAIAQQSTPQSLEAMEEPNGHYTIHNLPRGTETGVLIHSIFERVFCGESFEDLIPPSLLPWKKAISNRVEETLDLSLPMGFCLRELDRSRVRTEVEFLFEASPNYLKGFIDLVFEHRGVLYFVDWKTNWLGKDAASYSPDRLEAAMKEHQYHVQASIYREALCRAWTGPLGEAIYLFIRGPRAILIQQQLFFCNFLSN
jgi:exodeoxyribonuclease V beta subunit